MKKKFNVVIIAVSQSGFVSKRGYKTNNIELANYVISHELRAWHEFHCSVTVKNNGHVIFSDDNN